MPTRFARWPRPRASRAPWRWAPGWAWERWRCVRRCWRSAPRTRATRSSIRTPSAGTRARAQCGRPASRTSWSAFANARRSRCRGSCRRAGSSTSRWWTAATASSRLFLDLVYAGELVRPGALLVVDDLWMPAIRWRCLTRSATSATCSSQTGFRAAFAGAAGCPGGSRGRGSWAVLGTPAEAPELAWDEFVSFTARSDSV